LLVRIAHWWGASSKLWLLLLVSHPWLHIASSSLHLLHLLSLESLLLSVLDLTVERIKVVDLVVGDTAEIPCNQLLICLSQVVGTVEETKD
jgi:hypothetical protein